MRTIEWTLRERSISAGDVVIWVDVAMADALWQMHGYYIPPGAPMSRGKYLRFGHWLRRNTKPVEMAEAALFEGTLAFINGRHRFAWMRDQGAEALPLATTSSVAKDLADLIGTSSRICAIKDPWS